MDYKLKITGLLVPVNSVVWISFHYLSTTEMERRQLHTKHQYHTPIFLLENPHGEEVPGSIKTSLLGQQNAYNLWFYNFSVTFNSQGHIAVPDILERKTEAFPDCSLLLLNVETLAAASQSTNHNDQPTLDPNNHPNPSLSVVCL